jgi:hypothetical protein
MTTPTTVTDTALEKMLARRAHRADPAGLTDAVFAAIEGMGPRRGSRLALPASWLPGSPSRGLAWVLVAATLLLALLASALVVGSLPRPRPLTSLVPTGIDIVAPETGIPDRVVADGTGTLWAMRPGRLTRFDPESGARRTWTISDDASFAALVMAPARAGGVWIWSGTRILRFTGDGFAESITASATSATDLAEAPDGSLWATSDDRGLEHWDGSTWIPEPAGRPTVAAVDLLVAGDGDVWVANPDEGVTHTGVEGRGLSHLEGGRWVTYDVVDRALDEPTPGGWVAAIEEAADGSIWVVSGCRNDACSISRFDGRSWAAIDGPDFAFWSLEGAPDGSVWAAASVMETGAVARFADGRWTAYGAAEGLAGTLIGHVSATPAGVFVGTDEGLFRFVDERWVPAWPAAADAPSLSLSVRLVAVSADEAWVADERGIWHYLDGAWTGPMQPAGLTTRTYDLAVAADGTLWAATDGGVAVLREGRWMLAWEYPVWSIALGPDGTAWAGSSAIQSVVGLRLDGSPPQIV